MATTTTRPPRSAGQPSGRNWLSEVSKTVKRRPSSSVLYGVPGVGKTSFGAQVPGAVFLCDKTEDGINRLKESQLVNQDVAVLPPAESWLDVMEMIESLRTGEHTYKALVVDALGGIERLCHEEVCRREFASDWGERGFAGYQRGFEVSLADWRLFINALDALRDQRGMSVMLLAHARVKPYRNPEGPDYDRFGIDIHDKTWSITHRWADMVLFANYEVAFNSKDQAKPKAKAAGGQSRVLYTEHHAAYDAKNRHGLPAEISMGSNAAEAWAGFVTAIRSSKSKE